MDRGRAHGWVGRAWYDPGEPHKRRPASRGRIEGEPEPDAEMAAPIASSEDEDEAGGEEAAARTEDVFAAAQEEADFVSRVQAEEARAGGGGAYGWRQMPPSADTAATTEPAACMTPPLRLAPVRGRNPPLQDPPLAICD